MSIKTKKHCECSTKKLFHSFTLWYLVHRGFLKSIRLVARLLSGWNMPILIKVFASGCLLFSIHPSRGPKFSSRDIQDRRWMRWSKLYVLNYAHSMFNPLECLNRFLRHNQEDCMSNSFFRGAAERVLRNNYTWIDEKQHEFNSAVIMIDDVLNVFFYLWLLRLGWCGMFSFNFAG